ncbi:MULTISPECIES: alpha/beta hydrolase [Campylobacter]|uniref:alpha/beta hydrolase n=1 Tax=Campylobacter TaxID=194 RepID=UPI0002FCEDE4|nr:MULTISPECIES: alpha/beta hydrolase [Campylobacter]
MQQTLKRTLERVQGKSLLVGHSWGGVPITEAGTHEKVAALIYLSTTLPDNGECATRRLSVKMRR